MEPNPVATRRRRRVSQLLELGVFGLLAATFAARALRARSPPAPTAIPAPLTVDLESDPPVRLELLPGIGPALADAIRREREAGGPFGRAEGLVRVPGIGRATVEGIVAGREVRPRFGDR